MKRAIVLNVGDLTTTKRRILENFRSKALNLANSLLSKRTSKKLMDLHNATYSSSKKTTSFNSQVICDIERNVIKSKGRKIKNVTVKFNIPRNCKIFSTRTNFFVKLGIYPGVRVAVPIRQDECFQRYQILIADGWKCKTFGLISSMRLVAYFSKEKEITERKNVLGIDVNAKHFAVSVVSPKGKILYQTYLGKHIWRMRKQILKRRGFLQSVGNERSLKKLRRKERDYVWTNLGQMIREIIKIAKKYDAEISIEKLRRFKPKSKKFNKDVMRMPFFKFREILQSRCFDNNVPLKIVDSWHTSKWCYRCGAVGKGHSANYSIFRCKKCGFTANADRKASVNIAVKSLLERNSTPDQEVFQISNRRVPVNGLLRRNEVDLFDGVVQSNQPIESLSMG